MAANFLHGVETIEVLSGARPIRGVKTAVVGLVGTAPMFDVEASDRTLNAPTLVLNNRDARRLFGEQREGYTIPDALDAIFDQGAGIVIVVNVLNLATHVTVVAEPQASNFTFNAANTIQLAANSIKHFGVTNLVVKSGDGITTYTAGTDYDLDANNGIVTRKTGGTIPALAAVRVSYSYTDPTLVQSSAIIGTVDGSGNRTGLKALQDSYNLFGFFPKLLVAPVFCTLAAVTAELLVEANKLRAMALIDAPIGTTFAQAIAGRGPTGSINFNTSSQRAILCYPHARVYSTATDTEKLEPYSQRLAGVICAKDQERGYWWSPSNTEILGITGVERRLTAMINDPNTEVNLLNEAGVTTFFNSFGTGIRTWGNRSAAWPSLTHPLNFINIRRTADVIHESVEYSMLQFIDYPIDNGLIDAITESVNGFLRTLVARGAILDGQCTYDPSKNEPTQIALGQLVFDLDFMPPPPLERLTFESFINIDYLRNLAGTSGGEI